MIRIQPGANDAGKRLDLYLAGEMTAHSRSRIQEWIRAGRVLVDGREAKASAVLRGGESIEVAPAAAPPLKAEAEEIPLSILYQDAAVVAIDKPSGMVVHAGAGVRSGTMVNALLHHFGTLSQLGGELRPGIVHRLDKETSGVVLAALDDAAHRDLAAQFSSRGVEKVYLALVDGLPRREAGRIETPIERDPVRRTRMTTKTGRGRAARSEYQVVRRYARHALLEVRIHTGRTHQIRVHLASIGHPVAGDRLYGGRPVEGLNRFFLHAHRIAFRSPATGERVTMESPLPAELVRVLDGLL